MTKAARRGRETMADRCTIMVVEDEALIALDLAMSLEELGATVIGPFGSVAGALRACDRADAAILDVDVGCEAIFPVADRLRASATPILFHTARSDTSGLRDRYGPGVPILPKPARMAHIAQALVDLRDHALTRRHRVHAPFRAAS